MGYLMCTENTNDIKLQTFKFIVEQDWSESFILFTMNDIWLVHDLNCKDIVWAMTRDIHPATYW